MEKSKRISKLLRYFSLAGALACFAVCFSISSPNVAKGQAADEKVKAEIPEAQPIKPAESTDKKTSASETKTSDSSDEKSSEQESATDNVDIEQAGKDRWNFRVTGAVDVRLVLKMLSARFRRSIVASPGVTGQISADLYNVTFEQGLKSLLTISGLVGVYEDNVVFVYTKDEFAALERTMITETIHLCYLTASDAKTLISKLVSKQGVIATSSEKKIGLKDTTQETSKTYGSSDVLIIRDYKKNLKSIKTALKKADVRPMQIMIEATILSVELEDSEDLGVDLSVLAGTTFSKIGATGNLQGLPVIPDIPSTDINKGQAHIGTSSTVNFPSDATGGLSFGFVSGNVAAFIRALERLKDITILANPKLMVLNKQYAQVLIGREDGYIAATTSTDTSATSTVEFLESGTKLRVMPMVGREGYIRMDIHPEISTGSVKLVGTSALPTKETTQITTSVLVRDGRTLVIGGLFQETSTRNRSQVPLLGDIPGIGELMRYTGDNSKRRELIVLITPHIVRFPKEEELAKRVKEQVENVRVGSREGLSWWARVRMTDTYMNLARKAISKNNTDLALWYVDLAIALSPSRTDAINLKAKLSPKASWYKVPAGLGTSKLIEKMIKENDLPYIDNRNMPHLEDEEAMKIPTVKNTSRKENSIAAPAKKTEPAITPGIPKPAEKSEKNPLPPKHPAPVAVILDDNESGSVSVGSEAKPGKNDKPKSKPGVSKSSQKL